MNPSRGDRNEHSHLESLQLTRNALARICYDVSPLTINEHDTGYMFTVKLGNDDVSRNFTVRGCRKDYMNVREIFSDGTTRKVLRHIPENFLIDYIKVQILNTDWTKQEK